MKTLFTSIVLVILFAAMADAQSHGMMSGRQNPERFDRFRKMRIVEALKLNEDEAARFVAKATAHEDAVRKLTEERGELIDQLNKAISNGETKSLDKPVSDVLALDEKIFKERRRYQDELRSSLTPEKFAQYLIFEREFGRGVRNAIKGMARERRQMHR